ncbi:MAG: metal transporter substrate-binding protein [Rhodospirillales bacterium]|nr:metal transporter substrate-binding protein [Rhodospirillales bacterium]
MARPVFRFWGLVALVVALFGPPAHAAEVTIGYTGVADYLPLFVANDERIFKKNGLDVKLQLMSNSAVIPPALLAGSLQMAGIPLPVFLQAVAGGLDLRIFAGVGFTPKEMHNGSLMARSGASIHAAADLAGKKIGISGRGSFFHILLVKWLEDRDVEPRKVEFVETPFLQMADLLKAGQVDAVAVAEPFVSRIKASGIGYEVAPYISELGVDIPIGGYAVDATWGRGNAATIAALKSSIHEAMEAIDRNPGLIETGLVKYLKIAPELLKSVPLNRLDDGIRPEMLDFWQVLMLHQGLLSARVDPRAVILQ